LAHCFDPQRFLDLAGRGRLEAGIKSKEWEMGSDICWLIGQIVTLIQFVVIIWIVLGWLVAFNVVNPHNQFVGMLMNVSGAIVRPLLAPIQRVIPNLGGMDLSPIVLLLGMEFLRRIICSTLGVV
jgi:YggT family protein